MKPDELESRLREIGEAWTNDPKFVSGVMGRVEKRSEPSKAKPIVNESQGGITTMVRVSFVTMLIAVIAIIALMNIVDSESVAAKMLPSEIRKVLLQQDTVHIVMNFVGEDAETGVGNIWYARDQGFARNLGGNIEIDDGTYYWQFDQELGYATRQKSNNLAKYFMDETFPESDYERVPDEDITENGKHLRCFSDKNLAPYADGPQRNYTFIDSQQRIMKMVNYKFQDERWNIVYELDYQYNVPIDPEVFQPDFGDNVEVVDLNEKFDAVVGLDGSLYRRQVGKFEYAVHRADPLLGGGVSVLVSLRPKDGVPAHRYMHSPYNDSPQYDDDFRIRLARAELGPIKAQWFVLVPRSPEDGWTKIQDGKLKFQDTFSIWDNESDGSINAHRYEHIDLEIDVSNREKISLKDAAGLAYSDIQSLEHLNFAHLDMGVAEVNGQISRTYGNVKTKSPDEHFTAITEHIELWRSRDLNSERKAIEKQITSGQVMTYVPGVSVSGYRTFGDEELARAVQARSDLVIVHLNGTSITNDGLRLLKSLKQLESLSLSETSIDDRGLTELHQMPSLKELWIRETKVSQEAIEALQTALPDLKIHSDFSE